MKIIKWLLIALLMLAVLLTAGYLYLYKHGISVKMLEVDPPVDGQIKVPAWVTDVNSLPPTSLTKSSILSH